jgi:RNA polymerase sigma-70 factor (ECF subfamily)
MINTSKSGEPSFSPPFRRSEEQHVIQCESLAAPDRKTSTDADVRLLVAQVLSGDRRLTDRLVARLEPVIRARVLRTVARRPSWRTQRALQELDDIVQCVLERLFRDRGRLLAAWQPERGLSLWSFVALVSEREAGMFLRSGRRNPFREDAVCDELLELQALDQRATRTLEARDLLRAVAGRLRRELGTKGRRVLELLFIEARSLEEVAHTMSLSHAAVYAWRTRIVRAACTIRDHLLSG